MSRQFRLQINAEGALQITEQESGFKIKNTTPYIEQLLNRDGITLVLANYAYD